MTALRKHATTQAALTRQERVGHLAKQGLGVDLIAERLGLSTGAVYVLRRKAARVEMEARG